MITAPKKKLFIIPGAGHFTMQENPKLYFEALKEIEEEGGCWFAEMTD